MATQLAPENVRRVIGEVLDASRASASLALPDRCEIIEEATHRFLRPSSLPRTKALNLLPESTGLSAPGVEWALHTSISPFRAAALAELVTRETTLPAPYEARSVPPRIVLVILAGNVFTAALKAVLFPMLLGSGVLIKPASGHEGFSELLIGALRDVHPAFGHCVRLLPFASENESAMAAALSACDVVSVYGNDATIETIRSKAPAHVRVLGHGHGVGVAYVPSNMLRSQETLEQTARELAVDVAAYDQRGCLSPHAVWVEDPNSKTVQQLAETLSYALARIESRMPRGPLSPATAIDQHSFRSVAVVRGGTVFTGSTHTVSVEPRPMRPTPGYRNISVLSCAGVDDFANEMQRVGKHLKCIGVAGNGNDAVLRNALPSPLCPHLCSIGQMQIPPLHALADGRLYFADLVEWAG